MKVLEQCGKPAFLGFCLLFVFFKQGPVLQVTTRDKKYEQLPQMAEIIKMKKFKFLAKTSNKITRLC